MILMTISCRSLRIRRRMLCVPHLVFTNTITSKSTWWKAKKVLGEKQAASREFQKDRLTTIPNVLCMLRGAVSPAVSWFIIAEQHGVAITLLGCAGVSDFLDGWIARKYPSQASSIGTILDPLADKCLICTVVGTLTYTNALPFFLAVLIIGRDLCLLGFSAYVRYTTIERKRDFFNSTVKMVEVKPTFISKVNTFAVFVLLGATLLKPILNFSDDYMKVLWIAVTLTTVSSGLSYIFSKNTYKFVNKM